METPTELLDAMNSLTENDEWGGYNQLLEDVLDPNDWRLKVILKYRDETKKNELEKEKKAITLARQCLEKDNIKNPYAQALILRKLGARLSVILQVTSLSRNGYYDHVAIISSGESNNRAQLSALDILAKLETVDFRKLLEEK